MTTKNHQKVVLWAFQDHRPVPVEMPGDTSGRGAADLVAAAVGRPVGPAYFIADERTRRICPPGEPVQAMDCRMVVLGVYR